ncbi:hypothetical protein ACA910_004852 [Epithemia clementina (nom. ined.)]
MVVLIRPSLSVLLRPLALSNMMFHSMVASSDSSGSLRTSSIHQGMTNTNNVHCGNGAAFATTTSSSTTTTSGSMRKSKRSNNHDNILLLEGDTFAVSHDGIARTGYHLATPFLEYHNKMGNGKTESRPLHLAIEECYDIQRAHKKFVLRHCTLGKTTTNTPSHNSNIYKATSCEGTVDAVLGKQAVGVAPLGESLGYCLNIQEIDQGVFGSAGTGGTTWEASIAMGLFFASNPNLLKGHVMELGCGLGFGSILSQMGAMALEGAAAHDHLDHYYGSASSSSSTIVQSITLTDGNPEVLAQCRKNLQSTFISLQDGFDETSPFLCNKSKKKNPLPPFYVKQLQWELAGEENQQYDTLIACDVAYLHTQVDVLVQAIKTLVAKGGCFHIFGPYNRVALQQVCRLLQEEEDFDITLEFIELERYRLRPYSSKAKLNDVDVNTAYQSKSRASFLHATAKRRNHANTDKEKLSRKALSDID